MEILKLIPLLYYDLISRLFPGLVLIVLLPLALNRTVWTAWREVAGPSAGQGESSWVILPVMMAVGYFAGQMLAPISDWLERHFATVLFSSSRLVLQRSAASDDGPFPTTVRQFIREKLKARGLQPKEASPQDCEMILFEWYDAVRLGSPDLSGRLTKMRAEYRMYSGISTASLLTGGVHLLQRGLHIGPLNVAFLSAVATVSFLGLWGSVRMYRMFQISVISHYYIRSKH